ncbi:ATP-binding protein [Paracholeplasma manati]|uniref:ATP-binding protein n=1 Tax=Paracholeplasma manati TaxID=591373 RepID=UPI002407787D|nr:ATP-binding protein [Paracholeplasma manati]MDG0889232.1 ATP-binding protein [Paracholeplasma manati]
MLNIIEGKEKRPLKIVVYGPEGIGKSTFASQFPDPLFIDTEGGTSNLNIRRIKCNKSWNELITIVKEIHDNPTICKTVVLDTADWSETLCANAVCEKYRKNNLEDWGFGKGYVYLQDEFSKLLTLLDQLIEVGINVVITAHAKPRKFELPEEQGAFDRYEMKLTRQVAPLIKEWCDALFFVNYKIYVVTTETNSKKAQGGKRVLYTTHNPTYDAKNRFNLPEELELNFASIQHLFEQPIVRKEIARFPDPKDITSLVVVEKLKKMIADSGITDVDLQKVVAAKGHYQDSEPIDNYSDDFITRWIIPNWKKIIETIKNHKGEQ